MLTSPRFENSEKKLKFTSLTQSMISSPSSPTLSTLHASGLRSLQKYYKTSKIDDILGYDNVSSPPVLPKAASLFEVEVSENLRSLKQSLDVLRSKGNQIERSTIKFRNDIETMTQLENNLTAQLTSSTHNEALSDALEKHTTHDLQQAGMDKKMYNHLIDRLTSDILLYKQQVREKTNALNEVKQLHQQANQKFQQVKAREASAILALQETKLHKQKIDEERNAALSRFQSDLDESVQLEKQRAQRLKMQQEIAEIASNEIRDTNIKKWRELQLVNEFLGVFLKNKMNLEMNKYESVEKSFQKIKASTGIKDASDIVHRFLNRENSYSKLLVSIDEYERKVTDLKKTNEVLSDKLRELRSDPVLDKQESKSTQSKHEVADMQEALDHKSIKAESAKLVLKHAGEWSTRCLTQLRVAVGLSEDNVDDIDEEKLSTPQKISTILEILKEHLLKEEPDVVLRKVTEQYRSVSNDLSGHFNKRNNRISEEATAVKSRMLSARKQASFETFPFPDQNIAPETVAVIESRDTLK